LITNLSATNVSTTSLIATNITATNITVLNLQAINETVTNLTVAAVTAANLIVSNDIQVSDNLIAIGNSNTIASLFTTGGNVGIGNTAPSYDLDVTGDINFTGDLYKNGSLFGNQVWTGSVGNTISYTSGTTLMSNTSISNSLTVGNSLLVLGNSNTIASLFTTGGNVGIGTANPNVKFTVRQEGISLNNPSSTGLVEFRGSTSSDVSESILRIGRGHNSGNYYGASAEFNIRKAYSNGTNAASGMDIVLGAGQTDNPDTTVMTLLANSNVGIGNTSPSYDLDVTGDVNFTGDLYKNGTLFGGGTPDSVWTGSIGSLISYTSGAVLISGGLRATSNSNTIGAIFTTGGNVGIGTTSPTVKLDVTGDINFTGDLYQNGSLFSGDGVWTGSIGSLISYTSGAVLISGLRATGSSNTIGNVIFTTGGNVGIGNTAPSQILQVGDAARLRISNSSSDYTLIGTKEIDDSNNTRIVLSGSARSGYNGNIDYVATNNGSHIFYRNGGTESMRISNSGNVGIGTTSPSYKLDISGGAMRINSTSNTDGNIFLDNNAGGGVINFYDQHHAIWGRKGFGGGNDVMELHEYGSISFWTGGLLANQKARFSILDTDNVVFQFQQDGIDWKTDLYYDGDAYGLAFNYSNGPVSTGGYGAYGVKGFIDPFYNNVRMNFTGQHRSIFKDTNITTANNYVGLIVRSTGKYQSMNNEDMFSVGKDAISINESLPIVELTSSENDKAIFGVVSNIEDPNKPRTDKFGCWATPYKKEAGDERIFVNGLGEGAIWVSNKNGNLENGDYITSSSIKGYGQKQQDDLLHNYTVSKITMDCDFNPQLQPKKQIVKDILGNNVLNAYDQLMFEDVLDENGEIVYEYEYDIRFINSDGEIISEEDYNSEIHFIAAFVGVTYHCS
jgi:hypothetical protein